MTDQFNLSLSVPPDKIFSLKLELQLKILAELKVISSELSMLVSTAQSSHELHPTYAGVVASNENTFAELREKIVQETLVDIVSRYGE
jgi:hypothetical protein